jgi:hypothetical protein
VRQGGASHYGPERDGNETPILESLASRSSPTPETVSLPDASNASVAT